MDSETRERLLAETKSAAAALADDLRHVRRMLADQALLRGDVRRAAVIARRLLVDGGTGDLPRIASPRIGRLLINARDTAPLVGLQGDIPLLWAIDGGVEIATVSGRWLTMMKGAMDIQAFTRWAGTPPARMDLRPDQFMDQRVVYSDGTWANRRDVIQYVANVAHGVHSDTPKSSEAIALAKVANLAQVGLQIIDVAIHSNPPPDTMLDGVSYEMLCTLGFVVESSDVKRLESYIQENG